jgi:hypothetical protein
MQYIVNEVHGKAFPFSGHAKVFDNLPIAIEYTRHISKNQKLFIEGGLELNEEKVSETLKERLSSILISNESDKHKKWLLTAF